MASCSTLAVGVPFSSYYGVLLWIPGRDSLPALRGGSPRIQAVAGDYFSTMGIRVLEGRVFTPDIGRLGEYVVSDYLRARRGRVCPSRRAPRSPTAQRPSAAASTRRASTTQSWSSIETVEITTPARLSMVTN